MERVLAAVVCLLNIGRAARTTHLELCAVNACPHVSHWVAIPAHTASIPSQPPTIHKAWAKRAQLACEFVIQPTLKCLDDGTELAVRDLEVRCRRTVCRSILIAMKKVYKRPCSHAVAALCAENERNGELIGQIDDFTLAEVVKLLEFLVRAGKRINWIINYLLDPAELAASDDKGLIVGVVEKHEQFHACRKSPRIFGPEIQHGFRIAQNIAHC